LIGGVEKREPEGGDPRPGYGDERKRPHENSAGTWRGVEGVQAQKRHLLG